MSMLKKLHVICPSGILHSASVQFFIGPLTPEDEAMTQSRKARQRTPNDRVQYPRRT